MLHATHDPDPDAARPPAATATIAEAAGVPAPAAASRRVVIAGALCVGAVAALAAYDIALGWRSGVAEIERALDADGRSAALQTARLLGEVDDLLQRAGSERARGDLAVGAAELHAQLQTRAKAVPLVERIDLFDTRGEALSAAATTPRRPTSAAQRKLVANVHDAAGPALVFGEIERGGDDGKPVLPAARRVDDAKGVPAGVIVATLRIEALQATYHETFPAAGMRTALLHRDTTLLARSPPTDDALGRKAAVLADLLARAERGQTVTRDLSPLDNIDRFASTQALAEYPLVVVVTREAEPALAPLRARALRQALQALALAGLALGLVVVLVRALERRAGATGIASASAAGARPGRRIVWASALFLAAIVAFALYDLWRSYRDEIAATSRELDTHARVLAEQTARSVQAVDVVARHVSEVWRQGGLGALDRNALTAYLKEQGVGVGVIDGILLADAAGNVVAASYAPAARQPDLNISGTPIFAAVRDEGRDGAIVGPPRKSMIDGRWQFPLGRRLETRNGAFGGAVVARFRIEYFQNFYRDVHLGPGTTVTLLHRDGSVAARYPALEAILGQRFPRFAELATSPPLGADPLRAKSPIDGVERFGSLRLVPDYPLAILVARDTDAALAPWRSQAIGTAARTLTLGVLAAILLAALLRQLRQLDGARRAVETTQARFAAAVSGSDGGIWVLDYVGGQAFGSPRMRELLGMAPGPEVLPLQPQQAEVDRQVHPDDLARRRAALAAHLEGRTATYEVDYRARQPDGGWRWVHVHGRCVRDENGRPLRMAGSTIDIDARKRAEEQLRQSEERYALAMTGSNEAHWVWDIATDALHASTALRDLYGIPHDLELPGRAEFLRHMKLATGEQERIDAMWGDMLAGKFDRIDLEYRIVDAATGTLRWIHTRGQCFRAADGRALRVAGATVDVSERKFAEEALRTSEERLALVIAGSNEGILDWDVVNDRMVVSARALDIVGLDAQTAVRTQAEWAALVMPRFHPDDVPRLAAELKGDASNPAATHDGEYRVLDAAGTWRWTRFRGITVRDAAGRPVRWAGSLSDIDDRKRAEERRLRLEEKLRQAQKLEAIGTLAGGIAHDFNNILAAILGYGELAQRALAEGTSLRKHVDAAMSAGLRGKSLVERILAFSRGGMGERVPVHVQAVVEEALEAVATALPARVVLERKLAGGDAGVLGDPTQIHQVVMNLCTNAAHAMKGGGRLDVELERVRVEAPLALATSTLPAGDFLRLTVADTGSGIPPDVLGRIFDPFFTTKEVGVGTGLGLSLVHGIVTDLGGGIAVTSEVGRGSRFTIYLPCHAQATLRPAELVTQAERGDGETVLLVDDEITLVRLGEETLAELGYEPVGYASSQVALDAFRADPDRFAAVISDEAMPGLTGSELAREIRAVRPKVPLILMSGFVTPALAQIAQELSVSAVLGKPLAARELARALFAALRSAGESTAGTPGTRAAAPTSAAAAD